MRLDSSDGRPNALHFRPAEDVDGYSGAHEVDHHLGLLDEYAEVGVSPLRVVYNDRGIMTDHYARQRAGLAFLPTTLMDRNVRQIKNEIEATLNERDRKARPRAQPSLLPF
jgi:hypothetical protein